MKLILRDYIKLLKEDQELDTLLVDLLFSMNIEPKSRPQKGRQFGVDITAIGIDLEDSIKKVFLISVKQGDLNRKNWDLGQNAVRQSINEIRDVFIKNRLSNKEKKNPIKIVIVFNGVIEQSIQETWKSYVNELKESNIELIDWDIDKITLLVEKYLFNESLLPKEATLLLRKSLAFIDINDYDLSHIIKLYNHLLKSDSKEKIAHSRKSIRLLNICLNLIFKWSQEQNNIRNSLFAAEKAVLITWKYLLNTKLEKDLFNEFLNVFKTFQQIQASYFGKTINHCYVKDSFSYLSKMNHSEYCLISYEFIGIYAAIGLGSVFKYDLLKSLPNQIENADHIDSAIKEAELVAYSMYNFIKNNPGSKYPQYDEHYIDISLGLLLLFRTDRLEEAKEWLRSIVSTLSRTLEQTSFFPLFYKNHDELINSHVNNVRKQQKSSILLTHLAEWSVLLKDEEAYNKIRTIISDQLPKINLQLLYANENIEEALYTNNADRDCAKTKHNIKLYENIIDYEAEMKEELEMPALSLEKDISIFKYQVPYLGIVASRHYRTLIFPSYWRSLLKN